MKNKKNISHIVEQLVWPTTKINFGIANGWEGAAWIQLEAAFLGVYDPPKHLWHKIKRRSENQLQGPRAKYCGELLGSGGLVTLLEKANQLEPGRFSILLNDTYRKFEDDLCFSNSFDLHSGSAGMLISLLQGDSKKTQLLKVLYDRTLWFSKQELLRGKNLYLGYAHGVMGAIVALEYGVRVGGFKDTNNVRSQLLDLMWSQGFATDNLGVLWPKLRVDDSGKPLFLNSWCNGNSGICLGAAKAWGVSNDRAYLEILEAATPALQNLPTHSWLCCGLIGNALILQDIILLGLPNQKKRFKDFLKNSYLKHVKKVDRLSVKDFSGHSFWRGRTGFQFFKLRKQDSNFRWPSGL